MVAVIWTRVPGVELAARKQTVVGPASRWTKPTSNGRWERKFGSWLWCRAVVANTWPRPELSEYSRVSARQDAHSSRGGYCKVPHVAQRCRRRGGAIIIGFVSVCGEDVDGRATPGHDDGARAVHGNNDGARATPGHDDGAWAAHGHDGGARATHRVWPGGDGPLAMTMGTRWARSGSRLVSCGEDRGGSA